jgi:hypothetical protein
VCNPPTTPPSPLHSCVSSPCIAGDAAVQRECERVRSELASNGDGELLGSRSARVGQRHGQLHGCSIQRSNVGPAQRHVSTRSSQSGGSACQASTKAVSRDQDGVYNVWPSVTYLQNDAHTNTTSHNHHNSPPPRLTTTITYIHPPLTTHDPLLCQYEYYSHDPSLCVLDPGGWEDCDFHTGRGSVVGTHQTSALYVKIPFDEKREQISETFT